MSDKPKSRKRRLITGALVLAVIALVIFFGLRFLNKPNHGVIKEIKPSDIVAPTESLETLDDEAFSLKYPGHYEVQTGQNQSSALRSWVLVAHQAIGLGQASKIGISITNLPVGGVKEDSAYKQFEAFSNVYTLSNVVFNDEAVVIGGRTEPNFEKTALWPHGNILLTISFTAPSEDEDILAEFQTVLESVEWK